MHKRHFFTGILSATLSVVGALALLLFLLLVASASAPVQLREISAHLTYTQDALDTLNNGIAMSESRSVVMGKALGELDLALEEGAAGLDRLVNRTYAPQTTLEQLRWPAMQALNSIDANAGELTLPSSVFGLTRQIQTRLLDVRNGIDNYDEAQRGFVAAREAFAETAKQVVSALREQTVETKADAIYATSEQILAVLSGAHEVDFDRVFTLIGQLEAAQQNMAGEIREQQHALIGAAFRMNAHRRSMNQAVTEMGVAQTRNLLIALGSWVNSDRLYTLGAVNDARILLNIYTVLLLALLASFGLRLRASHRALNRSHDDLEQRVFERTADLQQANSDLKESQVQLVQAEKMSSLGQLVAGVMHEINTPLLYVQNNTTLTAEAVEEISSYVHATLPLLQAESEVDIKASIKQLLARRAEFDAQEICENLDEVASLRDDSLDGLTQISELVQSLKDFSRLDRAADDQFDVRQGIEKTLTITKNLLKYGVEVRKELGDVPDIYCSPSRLNQVFINIVTNAVQAMDGKGVLTIRTSFVPSTQTGADSVEIVFEDTGCGIAQEHLDKIMDPFFTTKPVGQGTGLGLSIVRQIVDQHDGQILIDSREGHGTRIALNFPVNPRRTGDDESNGADSSKEQAA